MLISHDRRFLETLSRAMVWLDRGTTRRLERGFADFEAWRDEVLEQEEQDAHKLVRQIVREEDWLRYGVTARRKRNVRRLGELHALRQRRRERVGSTGLVRMTAADSDGSGTLVIVAERSARATAAPPVVRDFSTRIMRGDRVGIVGPNGAGKTTLLSLLTGTLAPDAGTVVLGTGLTMVTLDQRRESLDPTATLVETLTGGHGDPVSVGGAPRHVLGYMKDFLFSPDQARTPVGVLSGGERGRLLLARALALPSNLLVLDEPTNDLDLETLDLLQELLADYAGTVLRGQPRPRLPRPGGDVGDRLGGRRALAGIRRRLHRHGGAARPRRSRRSRRRRRRRRCARSGPTRRAVRRRPGAN